MNSGERTVEVVRAMASAVEESHRELTKLDSAIGDGDHGTNMRRGFEAVLGKLDESPPDSPSDVLKSAAMTLIGKVGGAAGPLYGTAFLRASSALAGKADITPPDVAEALEAALGGVKQRGKAEPGDKTMVDALTPAVAAAKEAATSGSAADVLRAAADAAAEGAEATIPLTAKRGRASYLGPRSAGHKDPGAASTALLLDAAARSLGG
ncbi:MAG: dihydroxyacetone kinase subunit DhaL [Rubrobacteraceae bacterium]|jgi:dihydroxyacetone kinase-like protein